MQLCFILRVKSMQKKRGRPRKVSRIVANEQADDEAAIIWNIGLAARMLAENSDLVVSALRRSQRKGVNPLV